ncbi:MAG: biotin carboxylase N-terminal domain-containing protein, partial [Myxococcota bacterium]
MPTLRCVFIANRGEIAARIARSVRARGARAVGVYSEPDAEALHVHYLDAAVRLPGASPAETYLDIAAVLEAANRLGADAVHPGYGFLSENAEFAEACASQGLIFIGPSPEAIRIMGDKASAKRLVQQHGVPTVPGYSGEAQDIATLRREAERIGGAFLLKAAAGGGGRGMRRLNDCTSLEEAVDSARREAKSAFGDDTLIIEKCIDSARHIEVQIVGDTHGAVAHLFERDCSVQRRHQKIIEEAPSPAVDWELRQALGEAAQNAARAVDYVGAGTVEFLVD